MDLGQNSGSMWAQLLSRMPPVGKILCRTFADDAPNVVNEGPTLGEFLHWFVK